jgi:hypothetical protein
VKTIYTDTYALRPIVWSLIGVYALVSSIIRGTGWGLAFGVLVGMAALLLAAKDIRRRWIARREGRDPSIVRVVDE